MYIVAMGGWEMSQHKNNLIWIDLEMTGLDPDCDRIIEIATIVTDSNLNLLAEGPVVAIQQSDEYLNAMDEWNTEHHTQSGLVARVKESAYDEAYAEKVTLEFLHEWVPKGKSPMAGNSICQDRRFLYRYMPQLEQYFHYRHLDVSTVKELALRWASETVPEFKKESKHLALSDIKDSIDELLHYRKYFFNLEN